MKFFKLAWRNVFRNIRRSLITIIAIAIGLASLIFLWGLIDGMNEQMIENSTSYLSGHLKIHKKGYHDDKKLYRAIVADTAQRDLIARSQNVEALSARVEGKAMMSSGSKSRGVMVIGIDPGNEVKVTTIYKTIVTGRYLQGNDVDGVVIGDKLAEVLGVRPGEETVLITQAVDGSIGAGRYRVIGVFDTGIDVIDNNYAFLTIEAARDLYSLWGQATAWAVRVEQRHLSQSVAAKLSVKLGSNYEVLGWRKLVPSVVQMVRFHEAFTIIVIAIVFVVVGVGIANTILMAVMERTREFGIMMALGTSRTQVIRLIIFESLVLGVIGLIVGIALGIAINSLFAKYGIDFGQFTAAMETMPGLSAIVYPVTRWDHVVDVSSIVFIVSILPALYPAWRAASVEPVEAIRGIRAHKPGHRESSRTETTTRTRTVFWSIAVRGIVRNPRRALLTASATAFGLASFILLYALTEGWFEQMIDNTTRYFSGHLQIERQGFRLDMEPNLNIANYRSKLQDIKKDPRVLAASPRVQTRAMVSSPVASEPLLLLGVDADREQHVTQLQNVIITGRYLLASDKNNIVLGREVAEKLDSRVGEKVVVTAQQTDGNLGSAAYRVVGIFETGNDFFDGLMGLIPFKAGQELIGLNDGASSIVVSLKDRRDSIDLANSLNKGLRAGGHDALPWESVMPVVVQMIDLTRVFFYVVLGVVLLVIAMGVMNTLLMSVLERTREFGVMMALGTEPAHVLRIVVYESLLLAAVGIVAGTLLGLGVTAVYAERGMDLTAFMGASETIPGMTPIIKPMILAGNLWWPAVILFITGVVTAIYPASRAARLEPVTAIRHN